MNNVSEYQIRVRKANEKLTGSPLDTGLIQRTCNVMPLKTVTAFGRQE